MKAKPSILLATIVVAALSWIFMPRAMQVHDDGASYTKTTGAELIGGAFTLTDHTGKQVTDKDFRGKYLVIFFGFTHCPKVCPLGLHTITQALKMLGPPAEKVTPIFITVDPERDDVARLATFVRSYDPRLIGLTGSSDAIKSVAGAYRAYYKKLDVADSDNYNMDHSSVIYFMDPDGHFLTHFTSELGAEEIASRMRKIVKE